MGCIVKPLVMGSDGKRWKIVGNLSQSDWKKKKILENLLRHSSFSELRKPDAKIVGIKKQSNNNLFTMTEAGWARKSVIVPDGPTSERNLFLSQSQPPTP